VFTKIKISLMLPQNNLSCLSNQDGILFC